MNSLKKRPVTKTRYTDEPEFWVGQAIRRQVWTVFIRTVRMYWISRLAIATRVTRIIAVDLPATSVWDTSGYGKDMLVVSALHYLFDRAGPAEQGVRSGVAH